MARFMMAADITSSLRLRRSLCAAVKARWEHMRENGHGFYGPYEPTAWGRPMRWADIYCVNRPDTTMAEIMGHVRDAYDGGDGLDHLSGTEPAEYDLSHAYDVMELLAEYFDETHKVMLGDYLRDLIRCRL